MNFKKMLLVIFPLILAACSESDSTFTTQEITRVDFSGATALVLNDGNSTSTASSLAGEAGLVTASEEVAVSNLRKLAADGSLQQAIYTLKNSDGSSSTGKFRITISKVTISPTGEVYVELGPALLNGNYCELIIVTLTSKLICAGNFSSDRLLRFDSSSGNAYYYYAINPLTTDSSMRYLGIQSFSRTDETISTVLPQSKMNDIGLSIIDFYPLKDGSLLLFGKLTGVSNTIFRYLPSAGRLDKLDQAIATAISPSSSSLESMSALTVGSPSPALVVNEKFYLAGGVVGTLATDGTLSFKGIQEASQSIAFYKTSTGEVYGFSGSALTRIEPSIITLSLPKVTMNQTKVSGDSIYFTGTDANGKDVFVQKKLAVDGAETDLLGGRNLLVQKFDVDDNGDVYFGALDLSTTTISLYKYTNSTSQLSQLSSLPGDLTDIVLLQ